MTRMERKRALVKLWRFTKIYGLRRSFFKVAGRLRWPVRLVFSKNTNRDIAIIGCGQFAFSTIGFFIYRSFGARIAVCFDRSTGAVTSFAKTFGVPHIADTPEEIFGNSDICIVYVASNHSSHTDYAVAALAAGKTVYVEKPISVSVEQFERLCLAASTCPGRIFAGYNRPFSGAIEKIRDAVGRPQGALSLCCYISGHLIGPDHWYRAPEEGTRICGNAGHWIDLFIHILSQRDVPELFEIQLLSASPDEPDDNFSLAMRTSKGDLFSLMLSSRTEPFEGINETINLQWDSTIAKIDDFRRLTIWQEGYVKKWRFWPKDVGHNDAVLQPFASTKLRDWKEIEISTALMLRISDMVRRNEQMAIVSIPGLLNHCLPVKEEV